MSGIGIKTSIYMDTNILQDHFSIKKRFLDGFKLSRDYYALVKYIDENALTNKINICIPQIVIEEMKEHLFQNFESAKQSLKDQISEYKKIFGDLLEIDYNIKYYDREEYKSYILRELEDIKKVASNYFEFVEYPECFPKMIENSLRTIRPFANAKGKNKEYSDAGFKDALLLESIVNHCDLENKMVILFSNDGDFNGLIDHSNFAIARDLKDIIKLIDDIYELDPILAIRKKVENQYHRESLLAYADDVYDQAVLDFKVINIEASDDELFIVTQECTINEAVYTFNYHYDSVANEIIDCKYEITNE